MAHAWLLARRHVHMGERLLADRLIKHGHEIMHDLQRVKSAGLVL